jgi:hypothetical protein
MNKEVSTPRPVATLNDLRQALPTTDVLRYIKNDTFIADPTRLLGRVYYEIAGSSVLKAFVIRIPVEVDKDSLQKSPLTRSELVIDQRMSTSAEVLSFVSFSLTKDELYELRVIDNAGGRALDSGNPWEKAINEWLDNSVCKTLINDDNVGAISVVTGVVQKYLTSKKYRKFEAGAKGSGWGVNVAGNLYTSSSEFQLDVIYGLDLVHLPRAKNVKEFAENVAQGVRLTASSPELASVNEMFSKLAATGAALNEFNA